MKKSTFIAVSGLVIVFLFISAIQNKTKVYEKQTIYETPEEAIVNFIGYANVHEKVKINKGIYEDRTPQEFHESISRRYRLYNSNNTIVNQIKEQIPVLYEYELSLANKEEINYFIDS
ncbi:hypothetical protein GNF83_21800, partial [Clostridium perfringens]|nr:hypothetical protein [Clostridium perfringens]